MEIYANKEPDAVMQSIQYAFDSPMPTEGVSHAIPGAIGSLSPSIMAKTMSTEVSNTLRVFEKYFGPYPYKRLAVTNIPYSYGQGWPMLLYLSALSFLDSTQRNTLGITAHVELTDFFRAHESSHQWWGHRVSWKSYHDQWLSEGFAQFSGNLYVQFRRNEGEFLSRLRLDKRDLGIGDHRNRRYDSLGPLWLGQRLSSVDAPRGYSTVVYSKGGYVLHMIRMMMFNTRAQNPDEREARFIAMMQDFCKTYENKAASTEDFKAVVEKYMTAAMNLDGDHKMDWFFNQYVYGVGMAEYSFRYDAQPTPDGKFKVSGAITRSGVPGGWKDSLPLYIYTNGRPVRLGWVAATEPTTTFEFFLPIRPDKIALNSNEDILVEIKQ